MELLNKYSAAEVKAIRKQIENLIERYHLYKLLDYESREFIFESSEEMKRFCDAIDKAVSQLTTKEQFLIKKRYLDCLDYEYVKDYQIYSEVFKPPISSVTYNKIRRNAILKLALYLGDL